MGQPPEGGSANRNSFETAAGLESALRDACRELVRDAFKIGAKSKADPARVNETAALPDRVASIDRYVSLLTMRAGVEARSDFRDLVVARLEDLSKAAATDPKLRSPAEWQTRVDGIAAWIRTRYPRV
jgi:hypothetical protein